MSYKTIASVLAALFIMFNASFGLAQNRLQNAIIKSGLTMQEVREVTTFYYQNPQPDKMVSVLKKLVTVPEFTSDPVRFSLIARIFSTAARHDKELFAKILTVNETLTGAGKEHLERIINDVDKYQAPVLNSPSNLDLLWSEFFATGQAGIVKQMIAILNPSNPYNKMLVEAVEWSLLSNAQQHPRVLEILKAEAALASGVQKQMLSQIVQTAGSSK